MRCRSHLELTCWAIWISVLVATAGCAGEDVAEPDAAVADVAVDAIDEDTHSVVDTAPTYTGKCAGGPSMCDDGNPCTADKCDPFTGCSNEPKSCADDDLCTVDYCDIASGDCRHDEDKCDDNNICTVNACKPGVGCLVESTLDCEDGDKCTADGCSPIKGCVSEPLNCDDGKTCTTDSCDKASGCVHKGPDGGQKCCEKAADCEDNSPCTTHTCAAGLCASQPVFGCCKSDADCDDANACTTDACSVGTGVCANNYSPGPGCCASDMDCHDGDECTSDRCMSGTCGYDVLCCKTTADCDKGGAIGLCASLTCTTAGCAAAPKSGSGCCSPQVASVGFEVSDKLLPKLLPGTNGSWAFEDGQGVAKSGARALVYRGASTPIPGGDSVARALFPTISLPAATQISLRFSIVVQPGPQSPKASLRARVRTTAGEWHVWQNYAVMSQWQQVTINLTAFAARASTRDIQLILDVVPSSKLQSTSEIRVDDITVTSTCAAKKCLSSAQCNDSLAASKEACVAGACVYAANPDYCEYGAHKSCDDGDFCTSDFCSGNTCKHFKISNCCHNNEECADKDACTEDACVNKKCVNKKKPTDGVGGCCSNVAECDDGNPCTLDACPAIGLPCQHTKTDASCCISAGECDDNKPCTIDTCQAQKCAHQNACCKTDKDCDDGDDKCTKDTCGAGGKCSWTATGAKGCCKKEQLATSFENKQLGDFKLSSALTTSKWQPVIGAKAFKGKGALYYGNLAKGNYDDGKSSGTVTSGDIDIAIKEKSVLRFALFMDTESSATYDRFDVNVIAGPKKYKVWDKKAVGFKTKAWIEHSVDLSAFAGKTVKLQFEFDTNDGVANSGEGVYLDEIQLDRSCADRVCSTAAECNDGHGFSKDNCASGFCVYGL